MDCTRSEISSSFIAKGCFFLLLFGFFMVSPALCRQKLIYDSSTGIWSSVEQDVAINPKVGLSGEELRHNVSRETRSHKNDGLAIQTKAVPIPQVLLQARVAQVPQVFIVPGMLLVYDSFKGQSTAALNAMLTFQYKEIKILPLSLQTPTFPTGNPESEK